VPVAQEVAPQLPRVRQVAAQQAPPRHSFEAQSDEAVQAAPAPPLELPEPVVLALPLPEELLEPELPMEVVLLLALPLLATEVVLLPVLALLELATEVTLLPLLELETALVPLELEAVVFELVPLPLELSLVVD
jgi:hypothetical protein